MLAVFAIGSVLAGVVFGAVAGRWAPLTRLSLAGILFAVVMPWFALVGSPWWFGVVSLLAGLATTPMLISSSSVIETITERGAITVAMSWPTVAMSIGVTIASAVAGAAVDDGDPYGGLWMPLVAAALVLVTSQVNVVLRRPVRR
jgi:predicted MFS family arabinose efflux permease